MKQKSVRYNFIMNTVLSISLIIFPIITFPYVSRILLPAGTGIVAFATSIVSYFAIFAQLGIPTYGIRACARVRTNKMLLTKTVHEIFIINMFMGIFVYVLFLIFVFTIPRFYEEKTLFLIIGLTILFNMIGMEWLYKALEQYKYITIRSILFKVVALISMFLFIHDQKIM